MAREVLEEVGDVARGEWTEARPLAFHLRRRLSAEEELRVGPAVDCRNSDEGMKRLEEIRDVLPDAAIRMAIVELYEGRTKQ